MNNYNFSSKFKPANIFSVILFISSIIFIAFKGLNYGIDFKGGTLIELRSINTDVSSIRSSLNEMNLGDVNVKKFGKEGDFLIKVEEQGDNNNLIPKIKQKLSDNLNSEINFSVLRMLGQKAQNFTIWYNSYHVIISRHAFYIWVRFEWQFSVGAIVALFHDVVITLGVFSLLSLEINLSIIAAVLTIVGYSMNDTVVIYDRVREKFKKYHKLEIENIANLSINETLARTIITSATTLLALFSIFILGGEILKFSFAMILGVFIGTYSSIFVASPILKFFKVSYKTLEKEEKIVS